MHVAISSLLMLLFGVTAVNLVKPNRLPPIQNFVCYYGAGEVATLARYQLAIIETRNYSAADIRDMRKQGSIVVGYLSLGEILEAPAEVAAKGRRSDDPALPPYYLDRDGDGRPDKNASWGSLYVDARSSVWRARVLGRLIPELLEQKGVDGLFLDTLDTVDAYPQTREGMLQLVRQIREKFPHIPIVANRGFSMLDGLAPVVDAFLFEAFTTRWNPALGRSTVHPDSDLEWVDGVLKRIRSAGGPQGPQVLVLDYAERSDSDVLSRAAARARQAGLTYSISTGSLNRLPMAGGPGSPRK